MKKSASKEAVFRILAGRLKGRVVRVPLVGRAARPTLGRVREAVFSVLRPEFEGCVFLDLYAGTGQMGLEALSEGAKEVWWVDENRAMTEALRCFLRSVGEPDKGVLTQRVEMALGWLGRQGVKADVVYLDPPFGADLTPLLPQLKELMSPHGRIFWETSGQPVDFLPFFELHRQRTYGRIQLLEYRLCDSP